VRKSAILAGDIVAKHGRARPVRRKRRFGVELSSSPSASQSAEDTAYAPGGDAGDDEDDAAGDASVRDIACELVADAEDDEIEDLLEIDDILPPSATSESSPEASSTAARPSTVSSTVTAVPIPRAEMLKIKHLFAYPNRPNSSGAAVRGLAHFWQLGLDGLARELHFQEAAVQAETA
jgi:hypothetical protein